MTGTRVPARGAQLVQLHARQAAARTAAEQAAAAARAQARTDLGAAFALHGASSIGRLLVEGWTPRAILDGWAPETPAQRSLKSAVSAYARALSAPTPASCMEVLDEVRDWIADAAAGGAP